MTIDELEEGGVTIVVPVGRIDSTTADDLERVIRALRDRGAPRVVVDMAGVEYISSAGLRVFLILAKRMKDQRGALALAAMGDAVHQVFRLSGVLPLFTEQAQWARGTFFLVTYHVLGGLAMWSYLRTAWTRPPNVPQVEEERLMREAGHYLDQVDVDVDVQLVAASGSDRCMEQNGEQDELFNDPYCERCRNVKPERAHHCIWCERYVATTSSFDAYYAI